MYSVLVTYNMQYLGSTQLYTEYRSQRQDEIEKQGRVNSIE